MKIRTTDGSVEFARGTVEHGTRRETFLASPLGRGSEAVVQNPPSITYRIRPEPDIGATLTFHGERLQSVSFAFILPGEIETDWSVELELRRKEAHDAWLLEELGPPPYRYAWGEVESSYDGKGCASDIIVAYAS